MVKAIETVYKGYRFRSRLEARWAVFFDAASIVWEYEMEGYELPGVGRYLPDFWVPFSPGDAQYSKYPNPGKFIEIKPCLPTEDEIAKLCALQKETKHHCAFLVGAPGNHRIFKASPTKISIEEWNEKMPGYSDPRVWNTYALFNQHIVIADANGYIKGVTAARSARFEHGESPQ